MILDKKINVLKGAKKRHFPKGIIHGFCQKLELLFIWVFCYNQVKKDGLLIFRIEKNDF